MIGFLKKAVKWYFKRASESYAWMPTGALPYDPLH